MKKHLTIFILLLISIICFAEGKKDPNPVVLNEGVTEQDFCSELEVKVLRELNYARTHPQKYAAFIEDTLQYYQGSMLCYPNEIRLRTNEGTRAVKEAINFLQNQTPLKPMTLSRGMSLAAQAHVRDQGPTGSTGHTGSDGSSPFDRINRYGKWDVTSGENIDYGNNIARRIVMSLIIDDGVSGRGHRKNIFNSKFNVVGIGCGSHKGYRHMCVMDFAGKYKEKTK